MNIKFSNKNDILNWFLSICSPFYFSPSPSTCKFALFPHLVIMVNNNTMQCRMWMDVTFYLELQKLPVRQPNVTVSSYAYSPFSPITVKQLMLLNVVQVGGDIPHDEGWYWSQHCSVHWWAPSIPDCLPHQNSCLCLPQHDVLYWSHLRSTCCKVLHKGGSEVQTIRSPAICSKSNMFWH